MVGDAQDNHLIGGVANDTLSGLAGDDVLEGRGGDDLLNGGLGHDTLSGGEGIDTVTFADAVEGVTVSLLQGWASSATGRFSAALSGIEFIIGSAYQDSLSGNDGVNVIRAGQGADALWGWAGDDILYGEGGNDILYGGDGADQMLGGVGDDWLEGGVGDDNLWGDNGADHLIGGLGNDTYWIADQPAVVVEEANEGIDTIAAYVDYTIGDNIEQLILIGTAVRGTGNAANNTLMGNSQDNQLYGLDGDDVLSGESGADTLVGGRGNDAYWVDNNGDVVTELAGEGFDTVASFVSYTLSANFEQLILVGAATTATGNATGNMLIGNGLTNTLFGLAGDDVLSGEGGADIMIGGMGNDAYWVDSSGDVITELAGEGYDSVATFANYTLSANIEQMVLLGAAVYGAGNSQANTLTGNALNNVLDGQGGADRLVGGLGDDAYWVDNVGDVVVELAGEGFDTIASFVSYTLAANIEQLKLVGTVALTATGSSSANILNGNDLDNTLYGLGGDDVLAGEAGADTMIGGIGNDAYWVDNVGDVIVELAGEGFESVASSVSYTLSANLEQLVLLGAAVSATGNAQANVLTGNALDNTITGGGGNDILIGGAGADTFVFGPGSGHDRVTDFGLGGAHDVLNLSAFTGTGVTWTVTQQGANTVVAFSNGDDILLDGVIASHVTTQGTSLIWN